MIAASVTRPAVTGDIPDQPAGDFERLVVGHPLGSVDALFATYLAIVGATLIVLHPA